MPRLTPAFQHMVELPLGSVSMKNRVLSSGWNPYDFDIKGMPLQDIVGLWLSAQGYRYIFAQSSIFGTSQRTLLSHFVDIYFSHLAPNLRTIYEKSKRVLFVLVTVMGIDPVPEPSPVCFPSTVNYQPSTTASPATGRALPGPKIPRRATLGVVVGFCRGYAGCPDGAPPVRVRRHKHHRS